MIGSLYTLLTIGVAVILFAVPLALVSFLMRAISLSRRSPRLAIAETYLDWLLPALLFSSVTLGMRSAFPGDVLPWQSGVAVGISFLALGAKSAMDQLDDEELPIWYRSAIRKHVGLALVASLGSLVLFIILAPTPLASAGAAVVHAIEWIYSIPVVGFLAKFIGGLFLLYLLGPLLTLLFALVVVPIRALKSE